MTALPKIFLLALLLSAVAISTFFVLFVASAQPTPLERALQAEGKAYSELRAADKAGANVTALAPGFNSALALLENATKLERAGDQTAAAVLASEAENSFLAIIPEAQKLRDAATLDQQRENSNRTIGIPTAALVVAFAVVAVVVLNRRVKSKQFTDLRIKLKEEGQGTVESS